MTSRIRPTTQVKHIKTSRTIYKKGNPNSIPPVIFDTTGCHIKYKFDTKITFLINAYNNPTRKTPQWEIIEPILLHHPPAGQYGS